MIKEAKHWEAIDNQTVMCHLCPSECVLEDNERGICGCRYNSDGKLVTDNYGEVVTIAVDPIEKKPLYHFFPGQDILSTGANGCNLRCRHCQNWGISQTKVRTAHVSPAALTSAAIQHRSLGVAFTYTEPMIWFEYICDTAPLLHQSGLRVVLVSNGYINREPLDELLPHVDAINIDLKGMRPEFYRDICKGRVEPVLESIRRVFEAGVHLEITNLLIPGQNDSDEEIGQLVQFVADLSDQIPLHLSAYHPDYLMDIPATSVSTMRRAFKIARSQLKYVYIGNIGIDEGRDTRCPSCGNLLIKRSGYTVSLVGLSGSRCGKCGEDTGIVQ